MWNKENKFIQASCLIYNMVTELFQCKRNKNNNSQPKPTWGNFKEDNW